MTSISTSPQAAETEFLKEHRQSPFGKAAHAAQLFCILFAFLVPSLLLLHVVL